MQFPNARILIFAKAPIPGQVKTRLRPRLTAQAAAVLHADCTRYAVQRRCGAQLAPVVLYTAPDTEHPLFARLSEQFALSLKAQQGNDLGERMAHAAIAELRDATAVLLTGTDAPALSNGDCQLALLALQQEADVVMQPAGDGGYVMLGLKQAHESLFVDMPWGSDRVAEITRARCKQQGLRLVELPVSWDIDRPEDLDRLDELPDFIASRDQAE